MKPVTVTLFLRKFTCVLCSAPAKEKKGGGEKFQKRCKKCIGFITNLFSLCAAHFGFESIPLIQTLDLMLRYYKGLFALFLTEAWRCRRMHGLFKNISDITKPKPSLHKEGCPLPLLPPLISLIA